MKTLKKISLNTTIDQDKPISNDLEFEWKSDDSSTNPKNTHVIGSKLNTLVSNSLV